MSDELRLSRKHYCQILRHVRSELPREAVGIVGGIYDDAQEVIPLPNVAPDRAFLADPRAQFEAEQRLRELSLEIVAIYHSHPDGGTSLSDSDLSFGWSRSCHQIVVALPSDGSGTPVIQGYRVSAKGLSIVRILVE